MHAKSASSDHAGPPAGAVDDPAELARLDARVHALLPPRYQFCFDAVSPTSMGSAALKYGPDARVAWDEIWTHFCDLALAGGPPHKGTLLEAPTPEEVAAEPAGYQLVCDEIGRGIRLTTGLAAAPGAAPGWVTVRCHDPGMAAWLVRAVMAENVFVRQTGDTLQVPAGPAFRIAKEIKNVVVALAKTCHYWIDHFDAADRATAVAAMTASGETAGLLQPPARPDVLAHAAAYTATAERMAVAVRQATGLPGQCATAGGWVQVRLPDERAAAWHVRAAIAEGILARRETDALCLPVPGPSADRFEAVERLARIHRLWAAGRGQATR